MKDGWHCELQTLIPFLMENRGFRTMRLRGRSYWIQKVQGDNKSVVVKQRGLICLSPWSILGGLPWDRTGLLTPDRWICLGTESQLRVAHIFQLGKVGKWKKKQVNAKVLTCKGDSPLLAWRRREPSGQDLRITSRSWEWPLASSRQENGNLSATTVRSWIWPMARMSFEARSSQNLQMRTQMG